MKNIILRFLVSFLVFSTTAFADPVVNTNSATEISDLSAKISGTINVNSVGYWLLSFQIGITEEALELDNTSASPYYIQGSIAGNETQTISASNLELLPSTTYYYRFRARNLDNLNKYYHGDIKSFTTAAGSTLPIVTPRNFTSLPISYGDAELSIEVFSGGSPTEVSLHYGTEIPLSNQTSVVDLQPANTTENHYISITNLQPSTQYYYHWEATNSLGSSFSETKSFTTTALPTVTTLAANNITPDSATLRGFVNPNEVTVGSIDFEYGETLEYGNTVGAIAVAGEDYTYQCSPSSLIANTTYHFRIKHRRWESTVYGEDQTFTTTDAGEKPLFNEEPVIEELNTSSAIAVMPSLFSGTSATTLEVDYGLSEDLGLSASYSFPLVSLITFPDREVLLTGLEPNTLYYYQFRASNLTGTTLSAVSSFRTPRAPIITTGPPPTSGDVLVEITSDFDLAGGVMRPDIQIRKADEAYEEPNDFYVSFSDLGVTTKLFQFLTTASTTYYYRAYAFDGYNFFYGEEMSFTTSAPVTLPIINSPKVSVTNIGSYPVTRSHISSDSVSLEAFFSSDSSTLATYVFEYGTTNDFGMVHEAGDSTQTSTNGYLSAVILGLAPETKYFWRASATNSAGTSYSSTFNFTTLKDPVVTTDPAISVTDTSVTFVGSVIPDQWHYDLELNYGLDESMASVAGQLTPSSVDGLIDDTVDVSNRNVTASASGLLPGTTYYYQLKATPVNTYPPEIYVGQIRTFTTLSIIEEWRRAYFGYAENTGVAADLATPYGDGTPNLIKYAIGISPDEVAPNLMHRSQINGAHRLGLSFSRDTQKTDLIYTVEANNSLTGAWEALGTSSYGSATMGSGSITETPSDGSEVIVHINDYIDMDTQPKRFLRLKVTRPE